MIIQSIRLKHIKSYGAGPTGTGVTIAFEPGVNRVAGRNGHGKTTLIESIGYALFVTEPEFEENFKTETYFLSHGAKEGEIDVTFTCEGESYRIERVVGNQTRRRAKVIQLRDQSICAEGDQEVSAFLCRLLKFPDAGHLSEVFRKLVGVKQGRLAWPFDSKAGEAKNYFEPLLEVAVFRVCFDRLRGAVGAFEVQQGEHRIKQAAINERIRERADSPDALAATRQKVAETTTALDAASKARAEALKTKEQMETLGKAVETARIALASATQKTIHAKAQRDPAATRLADSKAAGQVLTDNTAAHQAHLEAAQMLGQLEQQRAQRDGLAQQRNKAEAERRSHQAGSTAARDQAKVFASQGDAKQKECDALSGRTNPLKAAVAATAAGFKKSATAAEAAQEHRDTISGWVEGLAGLAGSHKRIAGTVARLASEISEWDSTKLQAAAQADGDAAAGLKTAEARLAKAEQQDTTLRGQLKEISGGICPFLKEKCRQFNPAKVQADLTEQTSAVATLKIAVEQARSTRHKTEHALGGLRTAHGRMTQQESELSTSIQNYSEGLQSLTSAEAAEAAQWLLTWEPKLSALPAAPKIPIRKIDPKAVASLQARLHAFVEAANGWWQQADGVIKARLKSFHEEGKARNAQEATLSQDAKQLIRLRAEILELTQKAAAKEAESGKHAGEMEGLAKQVGGLDAALQPFANLDADLRREQQKRDANQAGYVLYLGAKKLADEEGALQARLTQLQADEIAVQQALQTAAATVQQAEQDFDPQRLKTAREDHLSKHDRAIQWQGKLDAEQERLKKEEQRFKEWEAAGQEQDRVALEIGRCEAAMALTELARKTLLATAPAVAQHLCGRIATRAQRVFNQINPDPIELVWDARSYSLRVTPGDRHFAMLSGGEQTKLALAMTLAMIEEFSGLRFCIFDEPTYGVDAESRHKLADAILQAQQAAGLDQLLLVSHDDAFEGKIEHAILLEKSAAAGTQVALMQ